MEEIMESQENFWHKLQSNVELVFEEGALQPKIYEDNLSPYK